MLVIVIIHVYLLRKKLSLITIDQTRLFSSKAYLLDGISVIPPRSYWGDYFVSFVNLTISLLPGLKTFGIEVPNAFGETSPERI
jgi:hypothetical protein